MKYHFITGKKYSRKNVKRLIGAINPDSVGGIWGTGYATHKEDFFIFATIGEAGRTGHNYGNVLQEDTLYWYTKSRDSLDVPSIKKMISGNYEVYIFTREDSSNPQFVFKGLGYIKDLENGRPASIAWGFANDLTKIESKYQLNERKIFLEGAKKTRTSTIYERNPQARQDCLNYYGYLCQVCEMDFESMYGEIGKGFIHVHHEKEISSIGKEYQIDPVVDLKPVCPNCHAMIHRRKPAYSVQEMKKYVKLIHWC